MFLTVESAKRWLPAVFLLLSFFLPWWTRIDLFGRMSGHWTGGSRYFRPFESLRLSFLWVDQTDFYTFEAGLRAYCYVRFCNIPFLLFVSALVLLGGLCGLSNEKRTRTLGGLLGVGGVIFYLILRLVFPPWWGWSWRDFYFGFGEYVGGMISRPSYIRAVWFLSVGFYLAVIGSLLLLVLSIRPLAESPKEFVFSSIGAIKELFFSTIAWIKRRLPAVFLLLSLLLPWWAKIELAQSAPFRLGNILFTKSYVTGYSDYSFPWNAGVSFISRFNLWFEGSLHARFSEIPSLFLVSALIFVSCLCGFSSRMKIRSLGGLLSILGVISFFPLVFHASGVASYLENPYFGIAESHTAYFKLDRTRIWFLSVGFYLAIAGSIMLLLPTIRTLVERLRKRL